MSNKDSAKDSNEDKKYYSGKLQKLSTLATDLSHQTQMIEESSRKLGVTKKRNDYD